MISTTFFEAFPSDSALALDDLHDLLRSLPVGQRLDADVGHEVARDLAGVQRVLLRYFERARRRLRLQAARSYNGIIQTRSSEILLGDDLLVQHVAKGVRDLETGRVLLAPRAAV